MQSTAPRAVGGHRLRWTEVPDHIQETIVAAAGASVTAASSKDGGFSPALASVLSLANGRYVFAKASHLARSTFAVEAIRREARILAALPDNVPAPPQRLAFTHAGGDDRGCP